MKTPKKDPKVAGLRDLAKTSFRMLSYGFKNFRGLTIGMLLSILITNLFPYLELWLGARVLDKIIEQLGTSTTVSPELINLIILLLGVFVLSAILWSIRGHFELYLRDNMQISFSKDVTTKLAYLDAQYYDDPKANDLINKVSARYGSVPFNFTSNLLFLVEDIIRVIASTAVLISLSPLIFVITLVASIPSAYVTSYYNKKMWTIYDEKAEQVRDHNTIKYYLTSEDTLKGLRSFRLRKHLIEAFNESHKSYILSILKQYSNRNILQGIFSLFHALGKGLNIFIIIQKVFTKTISVGQFIFYSGALDRLENGIRGFFRRLGVVQGRALYMKDIFDLLDLKPKVKNGTVNLLLKDKPPHIRFKNVSFKYPKTKEYILKDFNMEIESGENLAIVGENGAGKTTLIKLLMRFYDVTDGEILIDGINIKDLDLRSWYKTVGTLFQEFNIYHFDAKTNIALGDIDSINNIDEEKVISAAKAAGAHEFINEYKNKYNQLLSKKFSGGINPSTGQKQKIALARTFYKNPEVLILDEPTSAIDPKAEFEIFERLFDFAKHKTVIIISHRFSTVRNATRIIVLDQGKIIEQGTHEQLMAISNGKYKTAFELQKKGYE